jgi:polyphosphate kinase
MLPYIHRDVSWLSFNYRVLQEAKDPSVPLLERLKFLAIYSSNLDEFFRVRVANHRNLVRVGKKTQRDLEESPIEILNQLLSIVNTQQEEFSKIFEKQVIPALKREGINLTKRTKLKEEQIIFIEEYFQDELLPYVQPVLLQGNKIKPFLNNRALYLTIHLEAKDKNHPKPEYAIVKIPSDILQRFIEIPRTRPDRKEIIMMDDIVRHNIKHLFPGYNVIDSFSIKLTRDAELYIDDEYTGDLLAKIRRSLNKRNVGPASRMVYDREMSQAHLAFLTEVFELEEYDLLPEGRYHNNFDFFKFPAGDIDHLKDPPLPPTPLYTLESAPSIFEKIKEEDHMVHVPYHSYESVVQFFEQAAIDPQVTHIKIIQYRVASESRIMKALMDAVKNGKQVSAFIEIKARFDEQANIQWGEKLEQAGVTVNYSMPGLKVHSKMAIIRRFEEGKPMIYAHLSTGNFNEDTAKLYSDIGIFTVDKRLTSEATRLFSYLETKQLPSKPFEHIGVGQFNINKMLIGLIHQEVANVKMGKTGEIILKMNSLQDQEMIEELYSASQAGVKIKLIIRGICSLVPQVKGISENIQAISIVDRYLEHSRIFVFHNDGDTKVFLSSADWMFRNLHRRIETVFPIYSEKIKTAILTLLRMQLNDNVKARIIDAINSNKYVRNDGDLAVRSQVEMYYYIKRMSEAERKQKTVNNNTIK